MNTDLIIPADLAAKAHAAALNGQLESAAWLLFTQCDIEADPWSGAHRHRLILHDVLPLGDNDIASASPTHVTVHTASLMSVMSRARQNGWVVGFAHGHPGGTPAFSVQDDANESALLKALQNRNGPSSDFISLLFTPSGLVRGRLWNKEHMGTNLRLWVSGVRSALVKQDPSELPAFDPLDRQTRVFGASFNHALRGMKCLLVGAGGTGSPLGIMLARAGLGHLSIIDPDCVEDTNLHRLHGARRDDIGKPKAEVLAQHIDSFGLGTKVIGIHGNILEEDYRDLMKSADIIFGATDDHAGRMLMNRFAYFYQIPLIDIGLALSPRREGHRQDMTGRVTRVHSGEACLLCRKIVDPVRAREEDLARIDPTSHKQQIRDGYIQGGGEPEPAFIAMTTSVATMALEELTQMLCDYRRSAIYTAQRLRRFQIPEDRQTGATADCECPICGDHDIQGIGDIEPYLDRVA